MCIMIGLVIAAVWWGLILFIARFCGVNNPKEDEGKGENEQH